MGEIFNLSTLCRCCHSDGGDRCFKRLNVAYSVDDGVEIYEIILQETLGIRILQPSMVSASYLICDICIQKLQIVSEFRQQVLKCEEKFKVYCLNEQFVSEGLVDNSLKPLQIEIKVDPDNDGSDNDFPQDDGYLPEKTELDSPLPIKIKKEKIVLEVDIKHPIEENKIKNEENEDLKKEGTKAIDDNKAQRRPKSKIRPISKIKPTSKLRPTIKKRPNTKIKSKSVIKGIRKRNETNATILKQFNKLLETIKTENETTYKCQKCEKSLSNSNEIYDHMHTVHPEIFKCIYCGKEFEKLHYLRQHVKIHDGAYACMHCGVTFKSQKYKHAHELRHLNKDRRLQCDTCQKQVSCRSSLIKHIRTHDDSNKIHVCDQCGRSFHQRTNLEAHIQCVHLKLRLHVCTICSKTYKTAKTLKLHMKSHRPNYTPGAGKYKCDQCSSVFSSFKCLKKHRLAHENKYPCRYCPMICEGKAQYKEHVDYHIKTQDGIHNCTMCGKVFINNYNLSRHIDTVHCDYKRFVCDICGYRFSQKSLVQRHIRRKHESGIDESSLEKKKCPICKRMFINIENHLKNHEEARKTFICDVCGNGYITNSILTRHKKQKHLGISFDCEVCGKKYVKKKSLQNHRFKFHNDVVKTEVVERNDEVEILIH